MSQILPFRSGYDYLCGVDMLTGDVKGFAFDSGTPTKIAGAEGGGGKMTLTKCESSAEVSKSLNIDAKVSVRFGLFGAEGKFNFASESNINSYSVFVTAYGSYKAPIQQVARPVYDPTAQALMKQADASNEFRKAYDDGFVRALQTGGEYCALLEITTTDEQNKQDIFASLEASYGFSASGEASVKTSLTEKFKSSHINLTKMQEGGVISVVKLDGAQAIIDDISNFFVDAQNTPKLVPYEVMCVPYETVPFPGKPSALDYRFAAEALDMLLEHLVRYKQSRSI
jgi:hypothetical protein